MEEHNLGEEEIRSAMQDPKTNKAVTPQSNKMVNIRINPNRVIAGLGKADEEFEVSELVAKNFVAQGLATIIEKEN